MPISVAKPGGGRCYCHLSSIKYVKDFVYIKREQRFEELWNVSDDLLLKLVQQVQH